MLSALIVLGFSFLGVSAFAVREQNTKRVSEIAIADSHEITPEVMEIKDRAITLKDKKGKIYSFEAGDEKVLEKVKVGDTVKVKIEEGNAASIDKHHAEDITQRNESK